MSYGAVNDVGCKGIVVPVLVFPLETVSAPGNPLNRLSIVRFSWMMMTTCWILGVGRGEGDVVGNGVGVGDGVGGGDALGGAVAFGRAGAEA
jgi:hypothetical protein